MWNKGWIFLLLVLVVSACKTKKQTTVVKMDDTESNKIEINNMEINNLDFRYFAGKAKSKLELGKQNMDVTLNIRIQKDKKIWISATALFGIEGARVLITPDSIQVINKLQSEYIKKPFSYIYRYTSPGITFATLQDILLSNVSRTLLRTDQLTMATAEDDVQLVGIKDDMNFQYSLNNMRRPKVFRLIPIETDVPQSLEAYYSDYTYTNAYLFPNSQQIKINAGNIAVNAELNYSKVEFNEVLDFPFSVPARYKLIE